MKVGIITQPLKSNYGGILQNYALQQILQMNGHTPVTFDWRLWERPQYLYYLVAAKTFIYRCFLHRLDRRWPYYSLTKSENRRINKHFNDFIEKRINCSNPIFSSEDFVNEYKKLNLDVLLVGSDQVWRPEYSGGFLPEMYLSFAKNDSVRKVAYGASFGTNEWEYDDEQTKGCSELAKLFSQITVRETGGVHLCEQYLGVPATQVLDPTMLLSKEHYIKLIEEEREPSKEAELFNYILDPSAEIESLISLVEARTGYRSFRLLPKYQDNTRTRRNVKKEIECCIYPSITSWLRAFYDAKMTIVDSFHGMVFSIIFNKPFWVIGNKKRGLDRFSSLLEQFNLTDRMISIENISDWDVNEPINWESVNSILEKERERSLRQLLSMLD